MVGKLKQWFGYFSVFNVRKHREMYPYDEAITYKNELVWKYKKRFIWRYVAPQWMWRWFESIEFDNIYTGTPEDCYDKRTSLLFIGADNIYWTFFRRSPSEGGDWKWGLKFMKSTNDHVGCC